jgi:hypothetical protein
MATIFGTNIDNNQVASLDLRFADRKNLIDTISGENLITFSRSCVGTYVDSSGYVQTATDNTPRFDHDPITKNSLGLMIEESRTNSILGSTDIANNAYWSSQYSTRTANQTLSPDGLNNGTLVSWGGPFGGLLIGNVNVGLTGGVSYTLSVWAKGVTGVTYPSGSIVVGANGLTNTSYGPLLQTDKWIRGTKTTSLVAHARRRVCNWH